MSSVDERLRRRTAFAAAAGADALRRALSRSPRTQPLLLAPGLEGARWRLGKWRAWQAFERARTTVPAYRAFLAEHADRSPSVRGGFDPDLRAIPVTDKESYVKRYPIEARCRGGRLPSGGAVVDESSGTSGMPWNWVRGRAELAESKRALQAAVRHQLGDGPLFVLNAFALGPWATGMNVSMSVLDIAILKSTGPDIGKIENTLQLFGPGHRYLVAGYPPFLKTLIDTADVEWDAFDITAVYGGEGITEAMRDYLARAFSKVYGSYGAADLEINVAAENDFTVALRRLVAERSNLHERLGRPDLGASPLIFQYNPLDYYVETTAAGELVVTITRPSIVAPKIRYNVRDLGHVVRFPEVARALADVGIALGDLASGHAELPLLFLYGRADAAVAYYGSKVAPADVEASIFSLPDLARSVQSFALLVSEDAQANKRLTIALELAHGLDDVGADPGELRERLLAELRRVNQDFREASRFMPADAVPVLAVHRAGEGPFAGYDPRLKRRYVMQRAGAGEPPR